MPIEPLALPMDEAADFWMKLALLTREEFEAAADAVKAQGFFVSGVAALDQLADIHGALQDAVAKGETLADFKGRIADIIERKGWADWRVDTIFRTNIQNAYHVGRYSQMMEIADRRPWWRYVAVQDSRTRPTHKAMHGRIYRFDDPIWGIWFPINGFACRCGVQTLNDRQMRARGYTPSELPPSDVQPDKGFDRNPAKEIWKPDMNEYPEYLADAYEDSEDDRRPS